MNPFFRPRAAKTLLGLSSTILLAACGGGASTDTAPITPETSGWSRVDPGPTNVDGVTLAATCSGYPGTDSNYHFYVRRGTTKAMMVFFEGGGACWNDASCSKPGTASNQPYPVTLYPAEITGRQDPAAAAGMLSPTDASNPVRDWTMVYVPYCTGDMHAGSATMNYVDPGSQQTFQIQHRGADNAKVVLQWLQDHLPAPSQLLVTGSSAGGYGAVVNYPRYRRAYPNARAALLADAPVTVMPPSFETTYRFNWNLQLDRSVYPAPLSTPTAALIPQLAAHFRDDRVAEYTSASDLTLMDYYDRMLNGDDGVAQNTICAAWMQNMRSQISANQAQPNYRSYLAAGTEHAVLTKPKFDWEASASGTQLSGWVADLLNAPDANWRSVACTECQVPPSCPF